MEFSSFYYNFQKLLEFYFKGPRLGTGLLFQFEHTRFNCSLCLLALILKGTFFACISDYILRKFYYNQHLHVLCIQGRILAMKIMTASKEKKLHIFSFLIGYTLLNHYGIFYFQANQRLINVVRPEKYYAPSYNYNPIIFMLDFPSQKRLLQPILKHYSNSTCSDCDSRTPTWASLDYGVFLCSNCSGAHRALGPTFTRVKSTNLDQWREEWLTQMVLGNEQLNAYWEADPVHREKKPITGATPEEIRRYVYQKYVKKRYVIDPSQEDPLTTYRKGQGGNRDDFEGKQEEGGIVEAGEGGLEEVRQKFESSKKGEIQSDISLLQFDMEVQPAQQEKAMVHNPVSDTILTSQTEHATSFTTETSRQNFLDFNSLLQNQPQRHGQGQQLHHSYSTQAAFHHPSSTHNNGLSQSPQNHLHHNYIPHPSQPHHSPHPSQPHHSPPANQGTPATSIWDINI